MEPKKTSEVDLGNGKVGSLLFRLALPAIVAQVVNVLYNIVDRMYIGHIADVGSTALTGLGVTMPLITAVAAFAALVSMGGAPRASISMGKGLHEEAEKILGNCAVMLVIVSLILTAVLQVFGESLLMLFGASEETIVYAWDYLRIYSIGTIFVQVTLGLNAFINAQGYTRIGMLTVLIGALVNIILDPIFIYALGLGVKGAALATILSQGVSCVWVLRFLCSDKALLRLRPKNLRPSLKVMLPCLALGLSPFVMQFTESILTICFNTSLQKYGGDVAVGAMTICSSLMQFALLPIQGMCQGAQPIVSFNYGAGKIDRVKKAFRMLLLVCVCYSTVLWSIAIFAPQLFIAIFTSDPTLTAYAKSAMRVYFAVVLIFGVQVACQQTFVALGNAVTSLFLALLRKVFLLIPLIYILPHFFADQVFAVFLAEPVADTIAVSVTAILFFRAYRRLSASAPAAQSAQRAQ